MTERFRKDFIPELDGLRGIAVLLVLWIHLPGGALGVSISGLRQVVLPGNLGVDLFFVLSGFLITRILLVDRERGVPLRKFLIRRFLRIFPIYYLTIAVMLPKLSWEDVLVCSTYTSNYGYMLIEHRSPMEHTWSLAVEEHFYLLWPPLVAFLAPVRSRRILLLGILPLTVAASLALMIWGNWAEYGTELAEVQLRSSLVRFFSLGLGALLAYHELTVRARPLLSLCLIAGAASVCWLLSIRGLATVGLWAPLQEHFKDAGGFFQPFSSVRVLAIPFGSLAAVMFAIAYTGSKNPLSMILRSRPLRSIGRISYGLYLYHFPIFSSGVWGFESTFPEPVRVVVVLTTCFVVATLSYHVIERPLLQFASRFRAPTAPAAA